MRILAIDTALEACSAALLDGDTVVAEETQEMARGHAEALMPMLARLRENAAFYFNVIYRIAVTVGPGSFTGLRVGISAARGLGLAAGRPVVGVTTLAAFAAPVIDSQHESPVLAAIDARHDHVYAQAFSAEGETLIKPAIMPVADAVRAARFGPPHIVGNAASLLAERWPEQFEPPIAVHQQAAPDIAWVAWLGANADPAEAPPRPYYLRAPDAKTKAELAQRQ